MTNETALSAEELRKANDEAQEWLLSLLNATPPPRDAERFGAAIRAIRAKAIADAKEWYGLDAARSQPATEEQPCPWCGGLASEFPR